MMIFYTYSQKVRNKMKGNIITFGKRKWLVLDEQDDKLLIISEQIRIIKPFHNRSNGFTWAECSLRKYLNDDFLGGNFTTDESSLILETKNNTPNNVRYFTNIGSETIDQLFLLSIEEVLLYFGDNSEKYNMARSAKYIDDTPEKWWLRSPGGNSGNVAYVDTDGVIKTYGLHVLKECGVRPALWLKKKNRSLSFGGQQWLILETQDNKALIISEQVLQCQPYHESPTNITWSECNLRKYLNEVFLRETFTIEEQSSIIETNISNHNNPWYGTNGGGETKDKIFLLSLEEIVQYFGDSDSLVNHKTGDNDINDSYNSTRKAKDTEGIDMFWWLRTSGSVASLSTIVRKDGAIHVRGRPVDDKSGGVRPAMWINL